MRVRSLVGLIVALAAATLSGCGGGGGGAAAVPTTTVLSGMASKGPINGGTVKVYAIRNGAEDRSAPLGQGETDAGGNYTVDVGAYRGAVMVELTGGSYTDEVTGAQVVLKATVPLRAIFANASTGKKTVAVTPLTELAYKKAKGGGALTPAAIDDANRHIASFFKLADIVSTNPVTGAGDDNQKKYAFVLGSFAQLVNDNKNTGETLDDALPRLLTEIGDEMEHGGGLSPGTIDKMNGAITRFTNSGRNQTGATIPPISTPTSGILKLSSSGTANTIGAIDLTVNLPAGLRVNADVTTGETAAGVVTISGVAAAGDNRLSSAKFTPAAGDIPARLRIVLINTAGFGLGEFVTIRFDLAEGSFPSGKEAFSVASFAPTDLDGAPLGNITAAPASLGAEIR